MKINRSWEPGFAGATTFMKAPLVLDPAEIESGDVVILGAPMDELVTHRPGTRFGPRAIRQATDAGGDPHEWHMDLGVDPMSLRIVDHGDAEVVPGDAHASHRAIRSMVSSVAERGGIPIVLGGDHSIAFPDISALAAHLEKGSLGVVQFDTHADTATENWGVEWAHGTPFRHLVDKDVIPGSRLIQVGLRGYWPYPEEFAWMREAGVRWHRMEEITEQGIDAVMDSVAAEIEDASHLFLSIDIDALDPAYAPGTGTPEPGGMTTRELLRAVRKLVLAHGLAGMEVVEVSPPYDHAEITAMAAHRVILEALSALAVFRSGGNAKPEDPA